MLEVLRWYLALLAIGAVGLLPATLLFERLRSRGVLYARPLALLLLAQIAWLTAALTPVPYGTGLVVAALLALAAVVGPARVAAETAPTAAPRSGADARRR